MKYVIFSLVLSFLFSCKIDPNDIEFKEVTEFYKGSKRHPQTAGFEAVDKESGEKINGLVEVDKKLNPHMFDIFKQHGEIYYPDGDERNRFFYYFTDGKLDSISDANKETQISLTDYIKRKKRWIVRDFKVMDKREKSSDKLEQYPYSLISGKRGKTKLQVRTYYDTLKYEGIKYDMTPYHNGRRLRPKFIKRIDDTTKGANFLKFSIIDSVLGPKWFQLADDAKTLKDIKTGHYKWYYVISMHGSGWCFGFTQGDVFIPYNSYSTTTKYNKYTYLDALGYVKGRLKKNNYGSGNVNEVFKRCRILWIDKLEVLNMLMGYYSKEGINKKEVIELMGDVYYGEKNYEKAADLYTQNDVISKNHANALKELGKEEESISVLVKLVKKLILEKYKSDTTSLTTVVRDEKYSRVSFGGMIYGKDYEHTTISVPDSVYEDGILKRLCWDVCMLSDSIARAYDKKGLTFENCSNAFPWYRVALHYAAQSKRFTKNEKSRKILDGNIDICKSNALSMINKIRKHNLSPPKRTHDNVIRINKDGSASIGSYSDIQKNRPTTCGMCRGTGRSYGRRCYGCRGAGKF